MIRFALVAVIAVLVSGRMCAVEAGPRLALGGGFSANDEFTREPGVLGWASLRSSRPTSAFLRASFERHRADYGMAVCFGPNCPSFADAYRKTTLVPVVCGIRIASTRESAGNPFLEAAGAMVWTRYDDVNASGWTDTIVGPTETSMEWVPGFELGIGFHEVGPGQVEFGIRCLFMAEPEQALWPDAASEIRLRATIGIGFGGAEEGRGSI